MAIIFRLEQRPSRLEVTPGNNVECVPPPPDHSLLYVASAGEYLYIGDMIYFHAELASIYRLLIRNFESVRYGFINTYIDGIRAARPTPSHHEQSNRYKYLKMLLIQTYQCLPGTKIMNRTLTMENQPFLNITNGKIDWALHESQIEINFKQEDFNTNDAINENLTQPFIGFRKCDEHGDILGYQLSEGQEITQARPTVVHID